jgi:predicted SAM-dependent methyltransferase
MKLNLGCGPDIKPGYINIDSCAIDNSVIIMDIKNLNFPDNSIEEIYAKDIIEHLSITETINLINTCGRICKPGAKIFIQTINIDEMISAYQNGVWNLNVLNYMLFAGKNWVDNISRNEDFHKSCYSEKLLTEILENAGFTVKEVLYDSIDAALRQNPYSHNLNIMMTGIKQNV